MTYRPLGFDPMRFSKRIVRADELRQLIAEAAYYRAKNRNFTPGHEVDDWLIAEREVAERLGIKDSLPPD